MNIPKSAANSLAIFRRRHQPERQTVRSIGAEVFAEHAQGILTQTESVLAAIAEGRIGIAKDEEGPEYTELVQRQRESLLERADRELLLQELEARVRQAAQLEELGVRYPHLLEAAIRTMQQRRSGAKQVKTVEQEQVSEEVQQ